MSEIWIRAAAPPLDFRGSACSDAFELIEAAAAEGETPKLPRFSMIAYTGVPMRLEGQYLPVVVDLASAEAPRQSVPVPLQHRHDTLLGHTTAIEISAQRIKASGVFSAENEFSANAVKMAKNGFPWQASIGATAKTMEYVAGGDTVTVNGRRWDGPLYVARGATIREISLVPIGADGSTSTNIAARGGAPAMKFQEWLVASGFDPNALTDQQRTALEAQFNRTTPAPTPAPTPASKGDTSLEDVVEAGRRERERRQRITELVAEAIAESPSLLEAAESIGRLAIEGKWSTDKAEMELLRIRRPQVGSVVVPQKTEVTDSVLEAAVCMTGRLADVEKQFDARTLEAAHKHFRRGLGLQELILIAARANGCRELSVRSNLGAVLRAAFTPRVDVRAAGPSTHDISGIVGNTANKFLREGFLAVESAWRDIASIRAVNDFKQITSYTMTGDNTYEKVAPGGEIRHGSLGETSYTNQADTYGKMLGIDRRDLINDDLGALTGAGRRLGRGGALKLNDVFWTEWLDDSTFFPTDGSYGNYHADATTSLMTLAGLEKARLMFLRQTDPDSKPLGIMPKIILVPPELSVAAMNLMNSTFTAGAQSTATLGLANVFQGLFRVAVSTYLSNSSYTGYSITAWYMLADPADLSAIEVCFLNGVEMPTVETTDMDFDRLGISLRGYHDFGCNKQEYRAAVKQKGAA